MLKYCLNTGGCTLKRLKFGILLIVCLLLCACESAPKEVEQDMKKYGNNEQLKETKVKYCTVEELGKTDIKKVKERNPGIDIPDDIDFSDIKEVNLVTTKYDDNYIDKNREEYTKLFGVDNNRLKESENGNNGGGKYLIYEDKEQYFCIGDEGFLANISGKLNSDAKIKDSKVIGQYNLTKDDISDINVDFRSGRVSLKEMVSKTEDWYKDNFESKTVDYKITDVIIRKVEYEDEFIVQLSLCGEFFYKGMVFNNHFSTFVENYGSNYSSYVTYCTQNEYTDVDDVDWFTINNSTFEILDANKINKIVDFESAVRIVKEKLSDFRTIKFADVVPLYASIIKGEEGKDSIISGLELEARPVYAFLVGQDIQSDTGCNISVPSKYKNVVLVDMITGELFTDL